MRAHADFGVSTSASTDKIRACLARTVANDRRRDDRESVGEVPRVTIGLVLQTGPRTMLSDRNWEWREPQPAAASKDWHVKPMEEM